jgi:hypothetical protein
MLHIIVHMGTGPAKQGVKYQKNFLSLYENYTLNSLKIIVIIKSQKKNFEA